MNHREWTKILENSRDAFLLVEPGTCRILAASEGTLRTLGLSRQRLLKCRLGDLFSDWPSQAETSPDFVSPRDLEFHGGPSGRLLVEVHLQHYSDLNPPVMLARIRDRSPDLAAVNLAHESESIVHAILENTLDAIITIDQLGRILSFNKAAERLFGYRADEVCNLNVKILMPSPDRERHDGYLQNYLRSGRAKIIGVGREVIALRKDGSTFPIYLAVSREIKTQDRLIFTGLIRDLTREKQAERQMRQAQKLEAIGTLAGGIAHDFNNILGGITGYVELLLEDAAPATDLHEDLTEMLKACDRAKALIQQILTFSRRDKPRMEPLYVYPILEESIKLLRATLPATIEIQKDICHAPIPVIADPTQIHQIIMNLCTNAYHAMRINGGRLVVSLKSVDIDDQFSLVPQHLPFGPYLLLTVSDTGEGMDEETRTRAFEPFFTTKPVGEGTGMGLAVVHGIIRQMEGDLYCRSKLGEGSVFYVFLPVQKQVPLAVAAGEAAHQKGREHIMLVDDDEMLLNVQKRMLGRQGYQILAFSSSVEALHAFRANPMGTDLVLTDQTMPQMTGTELAREMLALRPDLAIILTTGFNDTVTPEKVNENGIRALLMKPVQKAELTRTIREVLDQSSSNGFG